MVYMTVREAAAKWNISDRLAQQYCVNGRIPGAVKFSGAWAIPQDAEKPVDPRRQKKAVDAAPVEETVPPPRPFATPMPLLSTPFVPGHAMESVEDMEDPEVQKLAQAELYYFSGRAEEAAREAELFLMHPNMTLRLSACWIYGYANLATGHIHKARFALTEVRETLAAVDDTTPAHLQALAGCIAMGAAVLLHLPLPQNLPDLKQSIRLLPPGLRLFVLYVQAHNAYLQGDYRGSIGIAETALTIQSEIHPIPTIYLHLVATMDYISLKQQEKAREHLLAAWELARPDDLIEAFGEHHGLLGGMLEAVIKKDWPEDFKRIIAITYSFSAGWRKIHNPDTGHDVADDLTTTEFAISMLAARDWTNQEIADHMGISPNTVKRHISTALQKLNITQRKELKQFMLR